MTPHRTVLTAFVAACALLASATIALAADPPTPVVGRTSVDMLVWESHGLGIYTTSIYGGLGSWMFSIRERDELVGCELGQMARIHNAANSMAVGAWPLGVVVIGTNVGTVEVRDGDTLQPRKVFEVGPKGSVYAVAISATARLVAACRTDGTVLVWDVANDQPVHHLKKASREGERMAALAFSPDGKQLVTLSRHGYLSLWDLSNGERVGDAIDNIGGEGSTMQFTPTGDRVVVLDHGSIWFWHPLHEPKSREVVAPEAVCPRYPKDEGAVAVSRMEFGHGIRFAGAAALSTDAKRVASVVEAGGIAIWDVETLKVLMTLPPPPFGKDGKRAGNHLKRVAFSPNGSRLAGVGTGGELVVWQIGPSH